MNKIIDQTFKVAIYLRLSFVYRRRMTTFRALREPKAKATVSATRES